MQRAVVPDETDEKDKGTRNGSRRPIATLSIHGGLFVFIIAENINIMSKTIGEAIRNREKKPVQELAAELETGRLPRP